MKPTDLRIGNLLKEKGTGEVVKVVGLSTTSIVVSGHFAGEWQAEPIPITEEWFEKFGFVRNTVDEGTPTEFVYYTLGLSDEKYCNLSLMSGEKNGYLEVCLFPYENFFRYKYVHEVQNLYYTITGKELIVQP